MPKSAINYVLDVEAVATTLGALEAATTVADTDHYISQLITAAHAKVADEFDAHIVADAMATGAFNHMFEWGTAGINKGRTTRRMNPMSKEAKLWEHVLTGAGKNRAAAFNFLPSKVPVPLPTTTKTGISQKYISKLKGKAIFWNKAAIMEAGTPIEISPRAGGRLFIPLAGWNSSDFTEADKARGFIMTPHSVTVTPGGKNIGTFTAYWERFWEGIGREGMQAHMEEGLSAHLERVYREAAATRPKPQPAAAEGATKAITKGHALGAKIMTQEANARARKRDHE